MFFTQRMKIGEILLHMGLVSKNQVDHALEFQKIEEESESHSFVGEFLVRHRCLSTANLKLALAIQNKQPAGAYSVKGINDPDLLNIIDKKTAEEYGVFPMVIKENDREAVLYMAMEDPNDNEKVEDLQFRSGYFVKPVKADRNMIKKAIQKYYSPN